MGGFFTFVEGTNQAPTGPLFDVQVRPTSASLPTLRTGAGPNPFSLSANTDFRLAPSLNVHPSSQQQLTPSAFLDV